MVCKIGLDEGKEDLYREAALSYIKRKG